MKLNAMGTTLASLGLASVLVVSCGKKTETETVYVTATPTPAPANPQQPQPPAQQPTESEADAAKRRMTEALAVEVKSISNSFGMNPQQVSSAGESLTVMPGPISIEFGLTSSTADVTGIKMLCKLESANSQNAQAVTATECTSPKQIQLTNMGEYTFTVSAVHSATGTSGAVTQTKFTVGFPNQRGNGQNGNGQNGGMGQGQPFPGQNGNGQGGIGQGQPYPGQPFPGQNGGMGQGQPQPYPGQQNGGMGRPFPGQNGNGQNGGMGQVQPYPGQPFPGQNGGMGQGQPFPGQQNAGQGDNGSFPRRGGLFGGGLFNRGGNN